MLATGFSISMFLKAVRYLPFMKGFPDGAYICVCQVDLRPLISDSLSAIIRVRITKETEYVA